MPLSCLSHVKRNLNNNENQTRPPPPPYAVFAGWTGDRSGSMCSMDGTHGPALYDWIKDTCDQARNLEQQCFITVSTFDDSHDVHFLNTPYSNCSVSLETTKAWTKPRGMTKLYDSAYKDLRALQKAAEQYRENLPPSVKKLNPKITVTWSLMTDGEDNSSTLCNARMLAECVKEARDKGVVCFFLAANCDGVATGESYGFDANTSLTFSANRECSDNAFRGISAQMRNVTSGSSDVTIPLCLRQSSCPAATIHNNDSDDDLSIAMNVPLTAPPAAAPVLNGLFQPPQIARQQNNLYWRNGRPIIRHSGR